MAEPLKTFFDAQLVASLAEDLRRAGLGSPTFAAEAGHQLDELELTARAEQIGRALRRCLPTPGDQALRALISTLGPPHTTDELLGQGMAPFRYLPHSTVIAELGPLFPNEGLEACYHLTQRFTAEFCLRPIWSAHPEQVWRQLERWVTDPSPHVRRLVSEGLRPRLPWAPRLRPIQEDPRRALALLERLLDDPATLVRRSVANFLGDVAKDHPDLAVETGARWLRTERATREPWVRHGLRYLVKEGHRGALDLLGYPPAPVEIRELFAPATALLGDALTCRFQVCSLSPTPVSLMVDLVLRFPGVEGRERSKVFKLGRATLAPGSCLPFEGKITLRALSTRTYRPGRYHLEPQVNGLRLPGVSVEVA